MNEYSCQYFVCSFRKTGNASSLVGYLEGKGRNSAPIFADCQGCGTAKSHQSLEHEPTGRSFHSRRLASSQCHPASPNWAWAHSRNRGCPAKAARFEANVASMGNRLMIVEKREGTGGRIIGQIETLIPRRRIAPEFVSLSVVGSRHTSRYED